MKLINFRCASCEKDREELFYDSEEQPPELEEKCDCGGTFVMFNYKNNPQVWKFLSARVTG